MDEVTGTRQNFQSLRTCSFCLRDRLKGNWGITDVEECAYVAQALSSFPYDLIDPKRIVIRGRSAGG